jgi:hypothetical protein
VHTPVIVLYVPAQFRVRGRRKARRVRTPKSPLCLCDVLTESTCRAFCGIFRFFWVDRVEMRYMFRFCAFQKGKSRACGVRERCGVNLEGDLAAQPPPENDLDASQVMREYSEGCPSCPVLTLLQAYLLKMRKRSYFPHWVPPFVVAWHGQRPSKSKQVHLFRTQLI